jgi:EmrB/QacA subfamily drug resistance transporter
MTTLMTLEHAGDGAAADAANHSKRWWILAVLGVSQLMVILDSTIVNIALPTAQHDLGFSNADRQWIVTAYSLAFGSLLFLGGHIGDVLGRKRALVMGLVGFAVASAIGGASVDFAMLVIARTIQGAFGALLAPSVLALLTTTFTDQGERGRAFGIYGAIAGAGGALGLLLGGALTSYASWRWTLFVNLVFAVLATLGALRWLKTDEGTDHDPLDLPGLLLVAGGLFSLVFGFSHAETTAWSDPFTIGFLVAGVVLLAAFAFVESRAKHPLLPPRVVLSRTRGGSALTMLFASVGLFGVFLFLTYYLQDTLGFSPVKTGVAFLPLVAVLATTAQVSNRILLPRLGPKPIMPIGLLVSAAALFGLHLVGLHSAYVSHVLPYLIVLGIGLGLSVSPAFSTGTLGLAPRTPAWDRPPSTRPNRWGDPSARRCSTPWPPVPAPRTWSVGRQLRPISRAPYSIATRPRSCGPPWSSCSGPSSPGWCCRPAVWRRWPPKTGSHRPTRDSRKHLRTTSAAYGWRVVEPPSGKSPAALNRGRRDVLEQ